MIFAPPCLTKGGFLVVKLFVGVVVKDIYTYFRYHSNGDPSPEVCTTILFEFIECFKTSRLHSIFNVDVL